MTYPTPDKNMTKGTQEDYQKIRPSGQPAQYTINQAIRDKEGTGQLNPDWVEWLMNWPCGWTSLEGLKHEHFEYWKKASATQIQGTGEMRTMWFHQDPAETSYRSQCTEQQKEQYKNIVFTVSREITCSGKMAESFKGKGMFILRKNIHLQTEQRNVLQSELCKSLGMAESETVPRVATGIMNRVDRLKAIGNGQVPGVAAIAFLILYNRIRRNK